MTRRKRIALAMHRPKPLPAEPTHNGIVCNQGCGPAWGHCFLHGCILANPV